MTVPRLHLPSLRSRAKNALHYRKRTKHLALPSEFSETAAPITPEPLLAVVLITLIRPNSMTSRSALAGSLAASDVSAQAAETIQRGVPGATPCAWDNSLTCSST